MDDGRDWIAFAEMTLGLKFRRVGKNEASSPCPWCGGHDRFHVWRKGNYWCRPAPGHCGRSGWLDELDGMRQLTKQELLEMRVAELERKTQEHDQRLSALERMYACQDHIAYHSNLNTNATAVDYWLGEGMNPQTIATYMLGYCASCPMAPGEPSYTIPVIAGNKLYNIRHRLANPKNGSRYRPHMSGLPAMLFNSDDILAKEDQVLILEGEKKSMVVKQETGLANVATMGKQSFKPDWANKLKRFSEVLVCYDPDALVQAEDVARLFGSRGRVMELPVKADDFFVRCGGTAEDFQDYVLRARPV